MYTVSDKLVLFNMFLWYSILCLINISSTVVSWETNFRMILEVHLRHDDFLSRSIPQFDNSILKFEIHIVFAKPSSSPRLTSQIVVLINCILFLRLLKQWSMDVFRHLALTPIYKINNCVTFLLLFLIFHLNIIYNYHKSL